MARINRWLQNLRAEGVQAVIIIDKHLLRDMSKPGRCENCNRPCPDGLDPHHLWSKGAGRVDLAPNIVSICRDCHNGFHASGKPSKTELVEIAAAREGMTPEEIEALVMAIRRMDKDGPFP